MARGSAGEYFNPRSSCEERLASLMMVSGFVNFNPRSSCEERHCRVYLLTSMFNFNPRSSCEERLYIRRFPDMLSISIHAPHARSDVHAAVLQEIHENFNPRSSCEERQDKILRQKVKADFNPRSSCEERPTAGPSMLLKSQFQSTLLMRGATLPCLIPLGRGT